MPLENYQFSYEGVTFNGSSDAGELRLVTGLTDVSVRFSDRPFPRGDGELVGRHYAGAKKVRLDIDVIGTPGSTALADDVQALESAFTILRATDSPLTFQFPGEPEKRIYARVIRRTRRRSNDTELGIVPLEIQLKCADPRIYSETLNQSNTFGTSTSVTNDGDQNAYPIIDFNRNTSQTAFTLTNNTNGSTLPISGIPASTTKLVADMFKYIRGEADIITIGGVDYYTKWTLPRTPFYLSPGSNSLTLSGTNSCQVFWRDTWI